jgi:Fe-S cluster assembly protein SufD
VNKFQENQIQLASQQQAPAWLEPTRAAGHTAFAAAPWPTRKTEAWKYCSLKPLADDSHTGIAPVPDAATDSLTQAVTVPGLDAWRLVLVNGQVNSELSNVLALEQVTLFSKASARQQDIILTHLGKTGAGQSNQHLFNQLNSSAINDGVLVHLGKNSRLDKPLHICSLTTSADAGFTLNNRVLVVLDSGAELTLIEQFDSLLANEQTDQSFTNALTEVVIGNNASLTHYRLQLMQENALHIGSSWINLQRDASYQAFHLGLGSQLTRNDVLVRHTVGGSHCDIRGVYVPQGKQLIDFHTCIEHEVAQCTSNEVFRGIINDQAKAVFNGRIHIHPHAQKSLAELSNKNLLLTNKAEINTKPELEIYADDVKCAHGATVAQLDDKARFYLQSRGISEQEAQVMLSFGFINELLDALPHEAIGHWLRPLLAKRFGREQAFDEELVETV